MNVPILKTSLQDWQKIYYFDSTNHCILIYALKLLQSLAAFLLQRWSSSESPQADDSLRTLSTCS